MLRNVKSSLKGTLLTLVIDISKDSGPSGSGKSIGVASTGGNIAVGSLTGVPDETEGMLGLNYYRPPVGEAEVKACAEKQIAAAVEKEVEKAKKDRIAAMVKSQLG